MWLPANKLDHIENDPASHTVQCNNVQSISSVHQCSTGCLYWRGAGQQAGFWRQQEAASQPGRGDYTAADNVLQTRPWHFRIFKGCFMGEIQYHTLWRQQDTVSQSRSRLHSCKPGPAEQIMGLLDYIGDTFWVGSNSKGSDDKTSFHSNGTFGVSKVCVIPRIGSDVSY